MSTPFPPWFEWLRAGLFPFVTGVLTTLLGATALVANRRWALRDKADAARLKAEEEALERNEKQQKLEHAGQEEWERGVLAEGAALRQEMRESLKEARTELATLRAQMLTISQENLELRRQVMDCKHKTEILTSENVSLRLEVQALKGHLGEIMTHERPPERKEEGRNQEEL
jgi:regulator of replication initiation timing